MKNFSRIFMVATAATLMMPASSEACWCNDMWMWCVGMDWKKEPGTINTVEVKQDIRCDSNDNGPCTTPGKEADAPEQECKPSTKVELVLEWKVEGTAHNEIFNVSASAGATLSITIEDSTGKKINQWCECCKRCTFIRKEVTTCSASCGTCCNIYGFCCNTVEPNAKFTEYKGWDTENRACTNPNSGCNPAPNPICPPSG